MKSISTFTFILLSNLLICYGILQLFNLYQVNPQYTNSSVYIAPDIQYPYLLNSNIDNKAFHIFSHGKPGQLRIERKWLNAKQIAVWLQHNNYLKDKSHLYIYNPEFTEGIEGQEAVAYLITQLNISIAASDIVREIRKDGDFKEGISNKALSMYDPSLVSCTGIDCSSACEMHQKEE